MVICRSIVEIDRAAAARYGLNVANVQDVVDSARRQGGRGVVGGRQVISASSSGYRKVNARSNRLKNILVPTPSGAQVPLASLVNFTMNSGAMNIAP